MLPIRRVVPTLGLALLLPSLASAQLLYTNHHPLTIADAQGAVVGQASIYPSVVTVPAPTSAAFRIEHIEVRLNGLTHGRLSDLDVLLVPPAASGRPAVLLLSDTGGAIDTGTQAMRFVDGSRLAVPGTDNPALTTRFQATDAAPADTFPGITPAVVSTTLDDLVGMDPTGAWSLYIVDDQTGMTGAVGGGWTLALDVGLGFTAAGGPITIASPAIQGNVQVTDAGTATVDGMTGYFTSISVELRGLTHPRPADLEIYLRAPTPIPTCYRLQADAGGSTSVTNLTYTIESEWTDYPRVSANSPLVPGRVRPQDGFYNDDVAMTSPVGCGYTVAHFQQPDSELWANGGWKLFIGDDRPGEDGSLESWTLHLSSRPISELPVAIDTPPSGRTITEPAATYALAGIVREQPYNGPYTLPDDIPAAAVRWRLRLDRQPATTVPQHYEEGPWVPLAAGQKTWNLTDVPLHWGVGKLYVDILDVAGNVRTATDSLDVNLPQPRYTLAEGATGAFFDLDVTIFNPTDAPARAELEFLRSGTTPIVQSLELGPFGRRRIAVKDLPGLSSGPISVVARPITMAPLVVERAMFWDARRYGGHAANAVQPSKTWYFAEGAQNGFFQTYLLVANPNDAPTDVTFEFQIEGNTSGEPLRRTMTVGPNTRETLDIGDVAGLFGQTFGARLSSTLDIVAERAMYFGGSGRQWEGGHESTGVPEPATEWLLAEGATGAFFDTYVLVTNPSATETLVTLEFLLPDGTVITREYPLGAYGRLSRNIEHEDPRLGGTSVSTRVKSSAAPVVVERAMYWPGVPGEWTEAHDGFGLTTFGERWGLADGRVGGPLKYATYILLANPNDSAAIVDVLFVRDNGEQFTHRVPVGANSRETIDAGAVLPQTWWNDAAEFSNIVTVVTAGTPIGVERATYWNSTDGIHWAGGANVQGTRLP